MFVSRIHKSTIVLAAIPYVLFGWPWFRLFREPWFYGGGLTVDQLVNGPSYIVAFGVAILSSLVTASILAFILERTGDVTALSGMKTGLLLWIGFVAAILGTQYTFEARPLAYFFITAGYPLVGLMAMGAIIGSRKTKDADRTPH